MEKNVWGVLIQKPLGTQGKRKTTTPTAPKNQNEVVLTHTPKCLSAV